MGSSTKHMIAENCAAEAPTAEPSSSHEYHVYDATDGDVATTLVLAIADVEGVDPLKLDFTLNDYVDPDALNRLFAGGRTMLSPDAFVQLHVAGREVRVSATGEVRVAV